MFEAEYPPEDQFVSIVIIGNFNPKIFNPSWLRLNDVIGKEDLESSQVRIIHPEIADFDVDGVTFQITQQRFSLTTSLIPWVRIADLTTQVFGRLLNHTPISQFGINYQLHFNLGSFELRNLLGRKLAPIQPWGDWGKRLENEDWHLVGGLRSLTMEENNPDKRKNGGFRRVQIEPSLTNPELQTSGVFMAVNDHYNLGGNATTEDLVEVIQDNFDKSIEESVRIVRAIMTLAKGLEV